MIQAQTAAFWRATLALCLGSYMIFSNLYISQPLLPMLSQTFGVSTLEAGLSVSVATLALGVSLLLYGPLSDAIGRRGIMISTMAIALLSTFAIAHVTDFTTLLLLRGIQGFALGGLPAVALAYMGDEFDRRAMSLALGLYIAANTLGGVSGRLLSGAVADIWGWQSSFTTLGVIGTVILLVFVWMLPPSRRFEPKPLRLSGMFADIAGHARNPVLLVACLIGGLNFFIFVNQYSYITFVLADAPFHLSATWLGMMFLTYLTGTLAASLSGKLVGQRSQPVAMMIGIAIFMVGTLLTLIPRLEAIILGFAVNACGFFFAHSQALGWVQRKTTHARASASALYLLCYYGGASSGGLYLDPFWQWSGWEGVVIGSLLILTTTMTLALWLRRVECRPSRYGAVATDEGV